LAFSSREAERGAMAGHHLLRTRLWLLHKALASALDPF
jgi:hypothetical protein